MGALVLNGKLVFLERTDVAAGMIVHHGEVVGYEIPNPGGAPPVIQ